jgi:hypothetical protein
MLVKDKNPTARKSNPFNTLLSGILTGSEEMLPFSLPNATTEPVAVILPIKIARKC